LLRLRRIVFQNQSTDLCCDSNPRSSDPGVSAMTSAQHTRPQAFQTVNLLHSFEQDLSSIQPFDNILWFLFDNFLLFFRQFVVIYKTIYCHLFDNSPPMLHWQLFFMFLRPIARSDLQYVGVSIYRFSDAIWRHSTQFDALATRSRNLTRYPFPRRSYSMPIK
jgi:hypothetical protein